MHSSLDTIPLTMGSKVDKTFTPYLEGNETCVRSCIQNGGIRFSPAIFCLKLYINEETNDMAVRTPGGKLRIVEFFEVKLSFVTKV